MAQNSDLKINILNEVQGLEQVSALVNKLGTLDKATDTVNGSMREARKAAEAAAKAQEAMTRAAESLRGELNPLYSAQQKYAAEVDRNNKLLSAGKITVMEYAQAQALAQRNLDQSTRALKGQNEQVVINGKTYNSMADYQMLMMRQQRQGSQQLGMQFNDLATSISTGASPIQAFNQQLGQMGFAMSQMGGKAEKVGNFLMGPWGAAITMATMAIGFLIEKFVMTGDESEKAESKIKDLSDSFDFAKMSAEDLARVNELLAEANKKVAATAIQAANATAVRAAADANAAQQAINLATAELAKRKAVMQQLKQPTAFAGGGVPGAALTAGQIAVNRQNQSINEQEGYIDSLMKSLQGLQFRERQYKAESYALQSAMDGNARATEAHEARINDLRNAYASGRMDITSFTKAVDAENAAYRRAQESQKSDGKRGGGRSSAIKEAEKLAKREQDIANSLAQHKIKADIEWEKNGQAIEDRRLAKQLENSDKMQEQLGVLAEMNKEDYIKPIDDALNRLAESYNSIGMSVSDAFKGMLTGATSWKDGMKGIINSVIDQLWQLYVVQQIVGLVSKGLDAIGLPLPDLAGARANGGPVSGNKPYLVGENGPELMVPGGSGTIIPNRNLGMTGSGGGINISVDARGSNDPAAVRAQVQQGILEAAPAIIAAAQARTVQGLRRPKLGGAMQ